MFLINADDFGMSEGINEAIYELIVIGAINSCSIMCNKSNTVGAINLIRKLKDKNINFNLNLHFNITEGNSMYNGLKLTKKNEYTNDKYFIENELKAQINFLKQKNVNIRGIDCHHNVNLKNKLIDEIIKNTIKLRVRDNFVYKNIYNNVNEKSLIEGLANRYYNEIMVHPALFIDDSLKECSLYREQRIQEYKLLKDNKDLIKKIILKRNKNNFIT